MKWIWAQPLSDNELDCRKIKAVRDFDRRKPPHLPELEGCDALPRFVYSLHTSWRSFWPLNAGRHTLRRLIGALAKAGMFRPCWAKFERFWMRLDPTDYVQQSMLAYGEWEPEIEILIRRTLEPGDCFVDIGANAGYFSLLASSLVGRDGCVLAIEPNPAMCRQLQDNLSRNQFGNVHLRQVCCGENARSVDLFISEKGNSGGSSLSSTNAHSTSRLRVECISADSEIALLSRPPKLVKIDVEGAELSVLRGIENTLSQYRPILVFELDSRLLHGLDTSVDEVVRFLELHNYSLALNGTTCTANPRQALLDG